MRHASFAALAVAAFSFTSGALEGATGAPPIRALIITGQNNHNWQYTSRVHKDTLEATGRFAVDITDEPDKTLAQPGALGKYQVLVLDYNADNRWGSQAEQNFTDAVNSGTGVVAIHAANNAFKGWTEYETMLGLMWREGTGHGKFHDFDVVIVDKDHPITKGMADFKAHPDELYHKLVNSQKAKYSLLAKATASTESGGPGTDEPMAFTLGFGKGRVFATPLGHVWVNDDNSKRSIADPQFKALLCRGAEWAATGEVTLPATWYDASAPNTLSDAEKGDGWKLLFDGKTSNGWKGFKKDKFPENGWSVKDGILTVNKTGGDICTTEQYGDFEFKVDWRATKGANSGIIYRSTEDKNYPWETGFEYQILDDANHADGKKPKTRAGTLYDVIPCAADVSRPAGEWNSSHIIVKGPHIQHFLNGFKVVDIDITSDDYKKAHAASKWPGMKDYGTRAKGVIALQEHGDFVEFRNIKVKPLE
jgi:type 1 glutamine amidotransferase